jgi:hypothetical protein
VAAASLQAFVAAHPLASEAEDALFLEAVALTRSGRSEAGASIANEFLVHYPGSFHARDAATLVARDAHAHGDCARVRRVLAPWQANPTPEIVTLARCSRD